MNGSSGPGYQTGNMGEVGGEAGAVDNRLSLDPNSDQWPEVGEWKDGETYTFTNVKVRQVSPGEFEVIEATPEEGPTDEEGGEAEPEPAAKATKRGGYSNPAIDNL